MSARPEIPRDEHPDVPSAAPSPSPSPPAKPSPREARLEDYLDHLCAPLVGRVPYERRQALRAEWRDHLEALAGAYEELGSTPEEALARALRQFGEPRRLGREWARAWRYGRPLQSVLPPMSTAFALFGLATLQWLLLLASGWSDTTIRDPLAWWMWTLPQAAPLWAGLLAGLAVRGRHVLGTFYALAALIPLTLGAARLVPTPDDSGILLPGIQFLVWMPVGCAMAGLGGRLRERWEELARPWVAE